MTDKLTLFAGDVGGTKTLFSLWTQGQERPQPLVIERYLTADYLKFDDLLAAFVNQYCLKLNLSAATFGTAGPVEKGVCQLTNVDWQLSTTGIANFLGLTPDRVRLVNDVEAMGHAVGVLNQDEIETLQVGSCRRHGNMAVIAPGTGLGETILQQTTSGFRPLATEAGHADFAPRTVLEIELLKHLTDRYGRASLENVLSGPGLTQIHDLMHSGTRCHGISYPHSQPVLPEEVTESAMGNKCEQCTRTLDLFIEVLAAEAGNLGLRALATGGIYIAGGIAPNILPKLKSENFLATFLAKTPMKQLMSELPLHVVLNPDTGLLGAAIIAKELADEYCA